MGYSERGEQETPATTRHLYGRRGNEKGHTVVISAFQSVHLGLLLMLLPCAPEQALRASRQGQHPLGTPSHEPHELGGNMDSSSCISEASAVSPRVPCSVGSVESHQEVENHARVLALVSGMRLALRCTRASRSFLTAMQSAPFVKRTAASSTAPVGGGATRLGVVRTA
jgi:hypothetical protein